MSVATVNYDINRAIRSLPGYDPFAQAEQAVAVGGKLDPRGGGPLSLAESHRARQRRAVRGGERQRTFDG